MVWIGVSSTTASARPATTSWIRSAEVDWPKTFQLAFGATSLATDSDHEPDGHREDDLRPIEGSSTSSGPSDCWRVVVNVAPIVM